MLRRAASLYDLGKIAIPDSILLKAGKLTLEEFKQMKTYTALTSERPYKKAWTIDEALEETRRQSGRQFDPQVVDAFLRVMR
ncbi:MAG TPA: hypothetical protein VK206_03800 [Anaerolineales bacterium]|nr:hypothetical protein [Anaerolineales bacterium]